MSKNKAWKFQHTTKVACLSVAALSLLFPQGLALANSDGTSSGSNTVTQNVTVSTSDTVYESLSNEMKIKIAAGEIPMPEPVVADLSKVKFTKEQAITKLTELFPILKEASVQSVELGNNNEYPASKNQMIWNIYWNYQVGNSGYGFNSQVDAVTGDLINAYISMPIEGNQSYYPPKLSKEQALEQAKSFVAKAAPSLSLKDLQLEENNWNGGNISLFGPVQYGFSFKILRNGIPSSSDYIYISIDANGSVTQFSKPSDGVEYPSSVASISQEAVEKKFVDQFDVELSYIPIYKNGVTSNWILGWRPTDNAVNSFDATTGNKIDFQGEEVSSSPVIYTDVPVTKDIIFQARSQSSELTAEEAAKLVEQVAVIPEGRTLISKMLDKDYMDPNRKIWRLTWGKKDAAYASGFPSQSSAEIDAITGEIVSFRLAEYGSQDLQALLPTPSGAIKLTKETAKQKAIEFVNRLYPSASQNLKLTERGDDSNLNKEGTQYNFRFIRHINGVPIGSGSVSVTFDIYGRLQYYSADRVQNLEKITGTSVATVTKEEALTAYQNQYKLKLQYSRIGGYYVDNSYIDPAMYLVYSPEPADPTRPYEMLDATSGKWITVYEGGTLPEAVIKPIDLKGHWAEQDLSTLVEYYIITPDEQGNVKPNEVVSVGDWLTMMVKASSPYYASYSSYYGMSEPKSIAGVAPDSPYYNVVSYAAERQWISRDDKLQMDQKLTREQLAVMLTAIVKYNKLSAFMGQDSVVRQYSDFAKIGNPGAVALAVKLGLLQGKNGKFNPEQTVTKAEVASVIMRLVKLQGKTDQVIGQQ
ncbi:YcdB/YcdC domain-containing protein [Paenibacillus segetis]|uniref:SLH domain-containing protein n=1 Tax=Paenibacillus segetis TaxID=1325360 RepID=A0ABQ1YQX2_9BACL|nr:YcdB/YcdC domain-containing protein [Paenibacillus segetis]GGH33183.1 hypothetical protein GCM10008013_38110 [Paenibacillus segetis]